MKKACNCLSLCPVRRDRCDLAALGLETSMSHGSETGEPVAPYVDELEGLAALNSSKLAKQKGKGSQGNTPRFADEGEFEAFWNRLEEQAQQERALQKNEPPTHDNDQGRDLVQTDETAMQQAYDRLVKTVNNRPIASELLRKTLSLCLERQPYTRVEQTIAEFPEYPVAAVTPYQVIDALIRSGGLKKIALDAQGEEVTPERTAALTEDEVDDLIDSFELETTELGETVEKDLSPKRRIQECLEQFPDRRGVFGELLGFIEQSPCTYKEIEEHFCGRDFREIGSLNPQKNIDIKASVFVDQMEKAGAIVWDKGWKLTNEGARALDALAD